MWSTCLVLAVIGSVGVTGRASISNPDSLQGQSRIVSGWAATEGQFPFMVSLRRIRNDAIRPNAGLVSGCGASIIHPEWAITAAHCIACASHVLVRVGTLNVSRPHLIFESYEYHTHPRFNDLTPSTVQHDDIGLVKFPFPLEYSHLIQPVRIQRSQDMNKNYLGQQMTTAGWGLVWGRQYPNNTAPDVLNWVYLRGVTNQRCLEAMTSVDAGHVVVDSTICAEGWSEPSQSTCTGDSGGPLLVEDEDGQPTLIGLTSFNAAIGCHVGLPAGFVRPGYYHDFITEMTGINFDW